MDPAETDLRVPALTLLKQNPAGLTTGELVSHLRRSTNPVGTALAELQGRRDDRFSQRVRNLFISDESRARSLPNLGLVVQQEGPRSAWVITATGIDFLNTGLTVPEGTDELVEIDDTFATEQAQPLPREGRQRRVVTQPVDLSIQTIVEQIDNGGIRLETDFQRKYIWDDSKASRLIESLLLNIPIPVCYFAEEPRTGSYEVVDGHQRLYSIWRFVKGDLPLRGLTELQDLSRLKYDQLTSLLQRDLMRRTIRCVVITRESDVDLKFEVFERLNTNSVALTAQEIRNCVCRGSLNDLLKDLVWAPNFRTMLGRAQPDPRMRDHELILRFFAISETLPKYKPPLKKLLTDFMEARRDLSDANLEILRKRFLLAIDCVFAVFGNAAFRRIDDRGLTLDNIVNRALFDAQMICLGRCELEVLRTHRAAIVAGQAALFGISDYQDAITLSTADASKLAARLRMTAAMLTSVGIAVDPSAVAVVLEKTE